MDDEEALLNWIDDESVEARCRATTTTAKDSQTQHFFPEYEIMIEPEEIDFAALRKEEKEFKYDEKSMFTTEKDKL